MKEEGKKKKEKVKTTGRIEEVMEITNGKYQKLIKDFMKMKNRPKYNEVTIKNRK